MRKTRAAVTLLSMCASALTPRVGYYAKSHALLNVCLELGMPVNVTPVYPLMTNTLLENAICAGNVKRVALLIQYNANVNVHSGYPLWYAVYYKRADLVSLLIKAGADVNMRCGYKLTISQALVNASYDIVLQLIKAGAALPDNAVKLAMNTRIDSAQKVECILTSLRQKS